MDVANHVVPGDILLLRSRGFRARGNLLDQAVERRGRGRFTHVAVVINEDLVADAVPQHGITLRKWRDIQEHYDLACSRVARNDTLAADPEAPARVLQRATYFYRQRYDVKALLRPQQDEATPPCSQLVDALYNLQLQADPAIALDAWAHSIDVHTQSGPWHQFRLADYGIVHAGPGHAPLTLSRFAPHAGKVPEHQLRNLQLHQQVGQFHARLAALRQSLGDTLLHTPQLADDVARHWPPPAGSRALGGDALLVHWHQLSLAGGPAPDGRLRSLRRFADCCARILELAHNLRDALARFDGLAAKAQQLAQQGQAAALPLAALCELGERLQQWGAALADEETVDEVMLRVQNYPLLHAELMEMDGEVDDDAMALAANTLVAISEADLVRLDWVSNRQPGLTKGLPRLRALLAGQ